ncbi:MAG: hypothetical protein ABJL44_03325 [Algibacter sp.]
MIGQVAIQRKLLALIYTLWKKDEIYNKDYAKIKIAPPTSSEAIQDREPKVALP